MRRNENYREDCNNFGQQKLNGNKNGTETLSKKIAEKWRIGMPLNHNLTFDELEKFLLDGLVSELSKNCESARRGETSPGTLYQTTASGGDR